eukprot:TRINITY_DN1025_c0_g1_i2.p1 TRINITY_DN1025_c0_g1~~TRINITY_DN1025_c0_g1_i2.p1  ORF type:complete len:201 (+),score=17.68 TRINITY_DN1025_c0_g1_i2:213-815(+)
MRIKQTLLPILAVLVWMVVGISSAISCSSLHPSQLECEETPRDGYGNIRDCPKNEHFVRSEMEIVIQTVTHSLTHSLTHWFWCSCCSWVSVSCSVVDGVVCDGERKFSSSISCQPISDKSWFLAMFLSVFLGLCGVDRCYLGHFVLGIVKFCTFGFFFFGYLVDILLLSVQYVEPADGSIFRAPHFRRMDRNATTFMDYP